MANLLSTIVSSQLWKLIRKLPRNSSSCASMPSPKRYSTLAPASASALARASSGCPSRAGTAAATRSLPETSRDILGTSWDVDPVGAGVEAGWSWLKLVEAFFWIQSGGKSWKFRPFLGGRTQLGDVVFFASKHVELNGKTHNSIISVPFRAHLYRKEIGFK